ncbi:hypothetical protein PV08_05989 [Exophiala spinifera]|uniref:Histone deacetylation protein Rxt3 n=1 Tax=Exophiala spinifera TaxID=91928 RepID=A0A0D2BXC7_9EURO|nr:uncharacterized protein PV08_05989 [Exophiala spinifera]KIW15939.1 hypothetical protein PV08_05989 [Exophiala spinifera]
MYGPQSRSMLPPSPQQQFPSQRFPQPPLPHPSSGPTVNNGPPPSYKRPGSSMSISSMLGGEPEKPAHDQYHHHHSQASSTSSRQPSGSGPSMSLGAVMSPPQYSSKPNLGEYTYKPRSKTPDRFGNTATGARPHRSSSGTMTQGPGPFYETQPRNGPSTNTYPSPSFGASMPPRDEIDEHSRRTSISGILQRPESQPQPSMTTSLSVVPPPPTRPESIPPSLVHLDRSSHPSVSGIDPPRQNGYSGSYGYSHQQSANLSRPVHAGPPSQPTSAPIERPYKQSQSPELRRPQQNGNDTRPYQSPYGTAVEPSYGAHAMARQDSVQSQSDRSVLGDRLRNRPYSPFAGSVASQSGAIDDQVRKGSDELSQHRAILGLSSESKRGRYSPLPQAVQGAQAQTPVPDAGIKSEHGRVFSGIGSGLGTTSANPTPTPQPLPASPFKQNDANARLSEENLMKMSRSASGMGKRSRKTFDEDARAESDTGEMKKAAPTRGKRSKYQHSYKLDLEETARKNALGTIRRTGTPTSHPSLSALQRQSSATDHASLFRPKRIIRISNVVAIAGRNKRRHLGFYKYDPEVTSVDINKPSSPKFDISIRPNLLPVFNEAEQINCTYTIRVPRVWLRERERGLICAERYLWGSGIYTDDSDPVAAAIHSGFIRAVHPPGIDEALLEKVIEEQNPTIEGSPAPDKPKAVDENKDLHITLVVLPQLERYAGSARFGVRSRSWPEEQQGTDGSSPGSKAPHDGVSFMVLKCEAVDDGAEVKRVGRTGKEKRERLHRELVERQRTIQLEKEKLARIAGKLKERKEESKRPKKAGATGMEKNSSNLGKDVTSRAVADDQENLVKGKDEKAGDLDVGQSPGDWIRQLAVAAA